MLAVARWRRNAISCDNGRNIHVGDHLIINYGCTILGVAEVTMGDWVEASRSHVS